MPDFSSLSQEDRQIKCPKECCKGKQPWLRPTFSFMLIRPAPGQESLGVRAQAMKTVWYCGHCNNQIPFTEVVANLPLTLNEIHLTGM